MKRWLSILSIFVASVAGAGEIRVGSKAFTEGFLLGEVAAQTIEGEIKRPVLRRFGLGNTGVAFEALRNGEAHVYPEYTGTSAEAILRDPSIKTSEALAKGLEPLGLVIGPALGFNNTYALAVTKEYARSRDLKSISDLKKVSGDIRAAFSHEFTSRADGLSNLQKYYRIDFGSNRESLEHSLAYEAISKRKVDLIDVYSTDSQVERLDLVVLEDDLDFFPVYEAVFLARKSFVEAEPEAWRALLGLAGTLDEITVRRLNARVEIEKMSHAEVVSKFLQRSEPEFQLSGVSLTERIWRRTKEHAFLVFIAVLIGTMTGLPLGILASRRERVGQFLLLGISLVQTIPSLALLCLLIPIFGIGTIPALVALYLYSLLPILLNTYVGLRSIDRRHIETAQALGLSVSQQIFWIELPLASRSIIAGIKTSTIVGIGTATLAALIGAGGYGAPIVSGLAMNDMSTVLIGAIPAAVMSLVVHFMFEGASRWLVPGTQSTRNN